ncbi:uncharacterized protein LOC135849049 [Planococcus citri]|uniref:uncharacterized protein LOC135849049 n=1 Tax=Planococcus citri TaxID=170843 RepID=UPI0031F736E2
MFKYKTIFSCDTRSIVLFFVILSSLLETNARSHQQINTEEACKKIKSQSHYSLGEMTGYWYGVEIVEHIHSRNKPNVDSCIKVELKTKGNDNVYLTWREKNLAVTYTFYNQDSTQRGVWTSLGDQTVAEKPFGYDYEQFAGKLFVVRASDNLVLTFCSSTKLFTLVLSKNYTMNSTELNSIHNSLTRISGLTIKDAKRYCRNGAYNVKAENFLILFILGFVAFKMYGRYS